jgi:hypothetical protein
MKKYLFSSILLFSMSSLGWADQTITGNLNVTEDTTVGENLTVNGTSWIKNSESKFGVLSDDSSWPGLKLFYYDDVDFPQVHFQLARQSGTPGFWLWEYTRSNGVACPQMVISGEEGNRLYLYDIPSNTPSIALAGNLDQESQFGGKVVFLHEDNQMPNQTLTGTGSILTQGLGDSRYVQKGQALALFPTSTATGSQSLSLGSGSQTSAANSVAFGLGTITNAANQVIVGQYNDAVYYDFYWGAGHNLFVIGNGVNNGNRSNAFAVNDLGDARVAHSLSVAGGRGIGGGSLSYGEDSEAFGFFSLAGGASTAYGENSAALGSAITNGHNSFAVGYGVVANNNSQVVLGIFNRELGTPASALGANDAVLIVGNGNGWYPADRSNALEVKKSGDTTIYGALEVTKKSKILVAPQGDISMGEFTAE